MQVPKYYIRDIEHNQNRFLGVRFLTLCGPRDYRPVFRAFNLSTLDERRDVAGLKFKNGLISGSIDAPELLARV